MIPNQSQFFLAGSWSKCKVHPVTCFNENTKGNDRGMCCTNNFIVGNEDYDEGPSEIDYGPVPDRCESDKYSETSNHYCQVYPDKRKSTQKSWLPCDRGCFNDTLGK